MAEAEGGSLAGFGEWVSLTNVRLPAPNVPYSLNVFTSEFSQERTLPFSKYICNMIIHQFKIHANGVRILLLSRISTIRLVDATIIFIVSGIIFEIISTISDFTYSIFSSILYVICYYFARKNADPTIWYYFWFYIPTIILVMLPVIGGLFGEKSNTEQIWQFLMLAWPFIPIFLLLRIRSRV